MNTSIDNEWYTHFFSGLNCEIWERAVSPAWTAQEVAFLLDVLNCQPGSQLLDVLCGFGRHAVLLARQGFSLTGIDLSTEFLRQLTAEIERDKLPIQLIRGDVTKVRLDPGFDGAYCLGNSFGYVDYAGMTHFVGNVSAALRPGARLVLHSGLFAESVLPDFQPTGHYEFGTLTMDIRNSYVIGEGCMATELTYTQETRVERHRFKHYVYTLSDVKRLLANSGLRTIAVYASTDKQPYQLGDPQAYLVAEKQ